MFESLGDVRSRAVTMGKIADILQARGQLDEALKIRNEEELPVYQRLGDVRSRAVTMGKIADILQARGQLDEALKIRTEEELPVYERLGDVRSRAVTMGKIADILQARGQLDEALQNPQRGTAAGLLSGSATCARARSLWARSPTSCRPAAKSTRRSESATRSSCRSMSGSATCASARHDGQNRRHFAGPRATRRGAALRMEELPVYEKLGAVR